MARSFAGGVATDNIVYSNFASATLRSISSFFYFNGAADSTDRRIYQHNNREDLIDGTTQGFYLQVNWSSVNGKWSITRPSSGAWHNIVITYDGSGSAPGNDPIIYIDGNSVAVTEISTPSGSINSGVESFKIGNRSDNVRCWNGYIAEYARWNEVILDAGEAKALGNGYSPLFIRPESLSFYSPLIGRYSPEIELVGGNNGTVTGATAIAHPRIIYPHGAIKAV